MSALRQAAEAVARTAPHPVLTAERLFATERLAAELDAQRLPLVAPLADLLAQAAGEGVRELRDAALRRLVDGIWRGACDPPLAERIVAATLARRTRSCDRALIHAYLTHYPIHHAAFETLRAAAATAAARHDWRWRDAGACWRLWEDPTTVAAALQRGASPAEMGFTGPLADSAFLSAAEAEER